MIKSIARCLILDPNGDFRKLHKIDLELWNEQGIPNNTYEKNRGGKLTTNA